jgi:hypothetical protein
VLDFRRERIYSLTNLSRKPTGKEILMKTGLLVAMVVGVMFVMVGCGGSEPAKTPAPKKSDIVKTDAAATNAAVPAPAAPKVE